MGCICSKAIMRSMSIREESSRHGLETKSTAWKELLTSKSSSNRLFTFVFSSNNVDTTIAKPEAEPSAEDEPDPCKLTRSKESENRLDSDDKNVGESRSLSFHTVEEYDALWERIHQTRSSPEGFQDPEEEAVSRDGYDSSKDEEGKRETGWRRKGMAMGLESLDVEFPAIATIKQRMQLDSPGAYVTPKFGSYVDPATDQRNERHEEKTVFSPELLAVFEDCMQQLEVEQDSILRHLENEVAINV